MSLCRSISSCECIQVCTAGLEWLHCSSESRLWSVRLAAWCLATAVLRLQLVEWVHDFGKNVHECVNAIARLSCVGWPCFVDVKKLQPDDDDDTKHVLLFDYVRLVQSKRLCYKEQLSQLHPCLEWLQTVLSWIHRSPPCLPACLCQRPRALQTSQGLKARPPFCISNI